LLRYRAYLEKRGHTVTSRWVNGTHQIDDAGLNDQTKEMLRIRFATEDWEDLLAANCCMSFTEKPRSELTRGGRHVEFGAAFALRKYCIVIGPRENVFHCLPQVLWFPSWLSYMECDPLFEEATSFFGLAEGDAP